jgi:alanyl-tRNA synthetase
MPPDIVQNIAKKEGVSVKIPDNFDSMIAELHSHARKEEIQQETRTNLPKTIALYYEDHYTKEFDAKVLWKNKINNGTEVILDKTAFYPEGGGQPADKGIFIVDGKQVTVKHVEKEENTIIHVIDKDLEINDRVHGEIDWDHRYMLMKHHTGTHVVNGALRTLFGEHIWQAGSQLAVNEARFDFSHYKSISEEDIKKIEKLANKLISQAVDVEKKVMERNDAEKEFGFRLYQGGVPPGDLIRVLNIPGIDVEACGGMHLNNTREIEKIRIIKIERIQDGVNRITFAAGEMVDKYQEEENEIYNQIVITIGSAYEIKKKKNVSDQLKEISKIFSVPTDQLDKTIKRFLKEAENKDKKVVKDLKEAGENLFEQWKKTQKDKKKVSSDEIKKLIDKAETIPGTEIKVVAETSFYESTATAGTITKEPNYVAHIYDGKKITSSASGNVNIDLREIAPEIGKITGGSGGGKPKMTQCGGPNKDKIDKALEIAKQLTKKKLKKL